VDPARRKLYSYIAVVAVYVLVFGWWVFFFVHQSEFLLARVARRGVTLPADAENALREATDESMRMFVFEGAFLGLMLLASMFLVTRSLQREVAVHRQQKNFLSAVTHELKSPLASAKLYIESLALGRAEGEKRERYLRNAHADLERLQEMIEQLLESARMSSTGPPVRLERLELRAELGRIVGELGLDPATATAEIALAPGAELEVEADPLALRTMLHNLLTNAIKYAGPAPRVELSLQTEGSKALVRVRDFGPGLKALDTRRIFEPFVRGGDELVRTRKGVGLGLYMVSELARAQRGAARAIGSVEGGGFAVEFTLPLARERRANHAHNGAGK
jgi:two-component system phosphate regulon sensor histidine kinase PhoR